VRRTRRAPTVERRREARQYAWARYFTATAAELDLNNATMHMQALLRATDCSMRSLPLRPCTGLNIQRGLPTHDRMKLTANIYVGASRAYALLRAILPRAATPRRVADVLAERRVERQVIYSLPATASAYDALATMLDHGITVVVLSGPDGSPLGLLTQSDYLRRVALAELAPRATPAADVMTPLQQCAYVFKGNDVDSALHAMAVAGCHHLPVFDDLPPSGRMVAVVSLAELAGLTRSRLQASRARRSGDVLGGDSVRYVKDGAANSAAMQVPAQGAGSGHPDPPLPGATARLQ
jgi:CBS domain-containing protein